MVCGAGQGCLSTNILLSCPPFLSCFSGGGTVRVSSFLRCNDRFIFRVFRLTIQSTFFFFVEENVILNLSSKEKKINPDFT